MKSQRIPENRLNVTKTADQFLENLGNSQFFNPITTEKTHTKQVDSKEV
jgi:hypothetical protein